MIVMEIVPVDKRRSKVFLDEDFALVLYRGEINRFGIKEGEELSEDTYQEILKDVLFKRARERVLYLLKASDKTEQELVRKLKDGGYPKEAIEYAVGFVKEHRFINDEDYGKRYVEFNSRRKSEKQIQFELQRKGLDKEMIRDILKEQPVDEEAQIQAYIRKKRIDPQELDRKERSKVMASLGRKGFSYEAVNRVLGANFDDI
ncbi:MULTISPECIES: regulatory protein RecX [Clostridia]|jgi:regulatory protein|uniref:Regulatory protein RecX n=1 Tax=Lacrimispora xylanolytica TaxID=29375 RepID=A0ABY7ADH8_9FIRM|nr:MULTISPECIES: regulatory protein RecX [Clostridia]WAJ24626.1 regulatory protein RecX [Lacrimispora xylanolytica]